MSPENEPDLVVVGERVVLEDGLAAAALVVRAGTIVAVVAPEEAPPARERVEAGGDLVLPGFVDSHVHVNEPGRTEWEGFETATRAAVAGGITTIVDMPLNSIPATVDARALEAKRAAAAGRCSCDVGFWGGLVPGSAGEIEGLAAAGALGIKCFMVDSGVAEFPAATEHDIAAALPILARLGLPLLVHAEDPELIAAAGKRATGDPRRYATWLAHRPAEAERAAIATLRRLARGTGAHVHIVHVTSRAALDELRAARAAGERFTGETCPHYLVFDAEDIPDGETGFKCAPPIRGVDEGFALHEALMDGTLSMIVSDHSPALPELKQAGGDFLKAWGGIASLEVGAAALMSIEPPYDPWEWSQWMAAAPAELAGLGGRKGVLAVGADADFAIWASGAGERISGERLHQRHPWTPYEGLELEWKPARTWVRGALVYDRGGFPAGPIGRPVQRGLAAVRG